VVGLGAHQLLEEGGPDRLQDSALFCRADAHLTQLRSDPVTFESILTACAISGSRVDQLQGANVVGVVGSLKDERI